MTDLSAMRGRPIRLTYLITDLEVGGVPLHLFRLATRLPNKAFQIQVISLAGVGRVGRRLQDAGISVWACHARSLFDLRAMVRLRRFLIASRPDVVHALLFHANMAARLIGPTAGIPARRIITEIQTVELERRWHLTVDHLTCRLSRVEVGNSSAVVDHLHENACIPRARLRLMTGGVEFDRFEKASAIARGDIGVPEDAPLLLWTGRLDRVKGFELLLDAFGLVRDSIPAHLVLVGEGEYRSSIERRVAALGLTEAVHLLGRRDDVPSLLKSADVFVFTSLTEGMPNSVIEAMACGLPVVSTDVAACRELIMDGNTGCLVRSRSPRAFADAVIRLWNDRDSATAMAERAKESVRGWFDLKACARRWEHFYRDVIKHETSGVADFNSST